MNRYEKIQVKNTKKGRRYRSTVKYPLIKRKSNDIYIIGSVGDRLDNLAYNYYGDSRLWWIIARANNIGKGDLNVPNGIQLRIPQDHFSIVDQYNQLNS
jgi:hypothetical protein